MKLPMPSCTACLAWGLLHALPAAAAEPRSPDAAAAEAAEPSSIVPVPLRVEPALLFVLVDDEFAPGAALTGFALFGPVELGVSGSLEAQLFGYNRAGVAAHAGLRGRLLRMEIDAAGTVGTAHVHESSGALLSDDPGASGGIDFVGARVGVTGLVFVARGQQVRLGVGVVASFEHDLDPYTVDYTYLESGWFDDETTLQHGRRRIGSDRAALRLVFMLGLD